MELEFNLENFKKDVLDSEKPVLVDFYADWCGPCNMMAPIIEELASDLQGKARVGKINVDENQDLAMEYNVMSIPTLIIFKEGKEVKRIVDTAYNRARTILSKHVDKLHAVASVLLEKEKIEGEEFDKIFEE